MFAVGVGNPETVKEADLILKDLSEADKILELLG
jgi:beta-phosphoglucomutase